MKSGLTGIFTCMLRPAVKNAVKRLFEPHNSGCSRNGGEKVVNGGEKVVKRRSDPKERERRERERERRERGKERERESEGPG
jgi:hypothetical protein